MLDLYHATRDDLIRIILDLRDTLADRNRQLAAVTAELASPAPVRHRPHRPGRRPPGRLGTGRRTAAGDATRDARPQAG